jgi:hypothetical protein
MRLIILIFAMTTVLFSSGQSTSKKVNEENLKTYFSLTVKNIDSTIIIVEFKFVNLDTMTLKKQYITILGRMNVNLEERTANKEKLLDKFKTSKRVEGLSHGNPNSLYYENAADYAYKEYIKVRQQDSLLKTDIGKIRTLVQKADNIKPIYYLASCAYTLRGKDYSVVKNTAVILLDLDYKILDKAEIIKRLYKLYQPISDFKYENITN